MFIPLKKKYILSTVLVFPLLISDCVAGAWLYEEGKTYNAEGIYRTFPKTSSTSIFLPGLPTSSANVLLDGVRTSLVTETQYGLSTESTIKAKVDVGYVEDKFDIEVISSGVKSKYKFTNQYTSIISEFAYRQQMFRDTNGVFSTSFSFFPGELVVASNESYFIGEQLSYEMRFLHGIAFDSEANFFGDYQGVAQTRYHYFEWQMAARHYPQLSQVQWDFDQHLGLRVIDDWLFVFGLYNTFHGASYTKRPYSQSDLNTLANSTSLTSNQRVSLINGIKAVLSQNSTYRDHKLNLKASYALAPDKNLSIESFSNVFVQKPFTNNTVVLTYDVKF